MKCGAPDNPSGPYIKNNGQPCKRNCAVGATRCNLHDARGPASKLAAERALALARLPGAEALLLMIEQWSDETCLHCGYPSADPHVVKNILRAIQMVLDRTGLPPVLKVEAVSQSDGEIILDHLNEDELAEFSRIMAEFKAFKNQVRARRATLPPVNIGTQGPTQVM